MVDASGRPVKSDTLAHVCLGREEGVGRNLFCFVSFCVGVFLGCWMLFFSVFSRAGGLAGGVGKVLWWFVSFLKKKNTFLCA